MHWSCNSWCNKIMGSGIGFGVVCKSSFWAGSYCQSFPWMNPLQALPQSLFGHWSRISAVVWLGQPYRESYYFSSIWSSCMAEALMPSVCEHVSRNLNMPCPKDGQLFACIHCHDCCALSETHMWDVWFPEAFEMDRYTGWQRNNTASSEFRTGFWSDISRTPGSRVQKAQNRMRNSSRIQRAQNRICKKWASEPEGHNYLYIIRLSDI